MEDREQKDADSPDQGGAVESMGEGEVKADKNMPSSKAEIRDALNKKRGTRGKGPRKSKIRSDIRRQLVHSDIGSGKRVIPIRVWILIALAVIASALLVVRSWRKVRQEKVMNIYAAAEAGDYQEVLRVLGKYPELASMPDAKNNATPLHYGAQAGSFEIVRVLIEHKSPVGHLDKRRRTPLHYAAESGNPMIVELLLDKNALVRLSDRDGMKPLYLAASKGHVDVIEMLLKSRAQVNGASRKEGMTALHHAALQLQTEAVRTLLRHKAKVNVMDVRGHTPLHYAVIRGGAEVVRILLEAGADPNMAPKGMRTAVDFAREENNTEILKILEEFAKKE